MKKDIEIVTTFHWSSLSSISYLWFWTLNQLGEIYSYCWFLLSFLSASVLVSLYFCFDRSTSLDWIIAYKSTSSTFESPISDSKLPIFFFFFIPVTDYILIVVDLGPGLYFVNLCGSSLLLFSSLISDSSSNSAYSN